MPQDQLHRTKSVNWIGLLCLFPMQSKKVQRRSLVKKGYELSKSIKGPTVTQKIVPVITATANKKANSERANDGPWMQNDKAELGKKDRAVVPVSCTNYFIRFFFLTI